MTASIFKLPNDIYQASFAPLFSWKDLFNLARTSKDGKTLAQGLHKEHMRILHNKMARILTESSSFDLFTRERGELYPLFYRFLPPLKIEYLEKVQKIHEEPLTLSKIEVIFSEFLKNKAWKASGFKPVEKKNVLDLPSIIKGDLYGKTSSSLIGVIKKGMIDVDATWLNDIGGFSYPERILSRVICKMFSLKNISQNNKKVESLKKSLKKLISLNVNTNSKINPLRLFHLAGNKTSALTYAFYIDEETVLMLLNSPTMVLLEDTVELAIKKKFFDVLDCVVDRYPGHDFKGKTLLHLLPNDPHPRFVEFTKKCLKKISPNQVDSNGVSAFSEHVAARNVHPLKLLLEDPRTDINLPTKSQFFGQSLHPLTAIIENQNPKDEDSLELAEAISCDPRLEVIFPSEKHKLYSGETLLHEIAHVEGFLDNEFLKAVIPNILKKVDPNYQDSAGNTPLHVACSKQLKGMARILLEDSRTRIDLRNKQGLSPLEIAWSEPGMQSLFF